MLTATNSMAKLSEFTFTRMAHLIRMVIPTWTRMFDMVKRVLGDTHQVKERIFQARAALRTAESQLKV